MLPPSFPVAVSYTHLIKNHETLDTLTLRDFRAICDLFDEGVYEAMALKHCVNGRTVYGGPAKESVLKDVYKSQPQSRTIPPNRRGMAWSRASRPWIQMVV